MFKRVFVQSAKSHTDRIMESKFKMLLRDLPVGKDLYVSGNGRLIKRVTPEAATPATGQQSTGAWRR
jgi:hypothetical protein